MITTTTLGELLINVYDKGAIEQLQNLETEMRGFIRESADFSVGGNGLFFAVTPSGDEGYGYINETGPLPPSQNEQVQQAKVNPVVFVGCVKVTGLGRAISSSNAMAFANGLQFSMDQKMKRMLHYEDSALFRDGTGLLGQYNVAVADTAVANAVDTPGAQWFRRNMLVDIFDDGTDVQLAAAVKVVDVDLVLDKITLGQTIAGVGDNEKLYLAGTHIASGANVPEILGLEAAIVEGTGVYLDIDRATVPEWESNVIDSAGGELDEDLLLRAENRITIISGASRSMVRSMRLVVHPNQTRKYFQTVVPQRQFIGMSFDAGYSKLAWNGKEFVQAHNCPKRTAYLGDFSSFNSYTAPGGEMQIDQTFGPPVKWAQGFDAGIAYWRCYRNYAIRHPNHWVKITNLADVAQM
jgi:hypothetical protein